jgi:hypothetical protein
MAKMKMAKNTMSHWHTIFDLRLTTKDHHTYSKAQQLTMKRKLKTKGYGHQKM